MIRRPFLLPRGSGEAIRGEVLLPEGPPPLGAVVLVHGFKGFRRWGFWPFVGEALLADGHAVVSFTFSLAGVADDGESFDRLEDFARNTFTREVEELHHVLAAVRGSGTVGSATGGELLPRPVRRIGVLGHSRGGAIGILAAGEAAAVGSGLHALVTWAAASRFDRWSEATKEEWRGLGRIYVLNTRTGQQMPLDRGLLEDFEGNRDRLDVAGAAAKVAAPWLIVHGEGDLTIGVEEARLLAGSNAGARLEIIPDAGHTFEARHPFTASTPALERALHVTRRHFARHLGPEGGAAGSGGGS